MPSKARGEQSISKSPRSRAAARPLSVHHLDSQTVERSLITGDHAGILEDYCGPELYQELCRLAQDASQKESLRGGRRVLILPGIMGSTLGRRGLLPDILWINPIEIAKGRLTDLALNGARPAYRAVGTVWLAYLKLKLRLKIAGYDADFYPFDWRLGLDRLGRDLARNLAKQSSEVSLVAHSMGGLVARAAIAASASPIHRFIMLGTPNFGSFAPVQAIRGTYSVVRKVAALDLHHSAEELAGQVFNTFPGLYQTLPAPEKFETVNLYDGGTWPANHPRPVQKLLDGAKSIQRLLAPPDERFFLIAGVNQETVTNVRLVKGEFAYDTSLEGDGTVPLAFAQLPGVKTYYVEASHGSLPNNGAVERAVTDLLSSGKTAVLPDRWSPARRGVIGTFRDSELRVEPFGGRRGSELSLSEVRHLIDEVASAGDRASHSPLSETLGEPPDHAQGASGSRFRQVVVGRRRQHRLDLNLALGSITEVEARAYVLGIFEGVAPSGAAADLDARLGGAIADFTRRRMFSGSVGEVFIMPAGRHALRAEMIVFAGLGPFDRFNGEVQQLVGEHVVRTLVRTNVEEFATVLPGGGLQGRDVAASLRNLISGFARGLLGADSAQKFRSITLCEIDPERYDAIKGEVYSLLATPLLDDLEVTLDEITLPAPVEPALGARAVRSPDPAYLIVRQETGPDGSLTFLSSVLGAGHKATVITGAQRISGAELAQHLGTIESGGFTYRNLGRFGRGVAERVLHKDVVKVLSDLRDRHLVVVHDAPSSRIPWETMSIGGDSGWFPAAEAGLSRKYTAENLSIAKWMEQRQQSAMLDILLVVNPTEDLDEADREGEQIQKLFAAHPFIRVHPIRGAGATKAALGEALRSGRYDVIHYAGHALFDPDVPGRSGILCSGRQVLSGAGLANFGSLPSLVFFNACEAGRIRGARLGRRRTTAAQHVEPSHAYGSQVQSSQIQSLGLAEAFLRGGVANYVGTYWPVGDASARAFAETFYGALAQGRSIGAALLEARRAVRDLKSVDWADYMHYGAFDFALKVR